MASTPRGGQDGRPTQQPFEPGDYAALKAELDAYRAAQGRSEKNEAGQSLGLKATTRYMEEYLGATRVYVQQTKGGQLDLDLVYKRGDTYYVPEAKAPDARATGREVPGEFNPDTGEPSYAMQGSARYLRDTLAAMRQSGNTESMRMARDLEAALRAQKVVYMQVSARPHTNNPNEFYFSITQYRINGTP